MPFCPALWFFRLWEWALGAFHTIKEAKVQLDIRLWLTFAIAKWSSSDIIFVLGIAQLECWNDGTLE
jgi:hypothetical protein